MKKYLNLMFASLLFFSHSISAQEITPQEEGLEDEIQELEKAAIPTTTIEFEEQEFVWGQIVQGEKIQNVFRFTNSGNEPLILTNVKGSCGCTVPRWPKEPIAPGETAEILVQFNSKGKKGKQSKRVTITANTKPAQTFLTIKGEVLIPEEGAKAATRSADFDININSVIVYPNPSDGILNLSMKDFAGKSALVEIYNNTGQQLESRQLDELTLDPINFDVSQYASGVYTISVKVEGMNWIAKQFSVLSR